MDLPVNLLFWVISLMPIIILMFLMIVLQWGALKSAPVTLFLTILSGLFLFRADLGVIGVELLKALWNSSSIVMVIISAIFLYEVSNESNALKILDNLFRKVAPNELVRIFLIGVAFASFLQGVTGFGVPVLVTAPLLLKIGVAPTWAVIIPLIGHSWAGTFGTLAIAWEALLQQIPNSSPSFIFSGAVFASIFLLILTLCANFFIAFNYGKKQAVYKVVPLLILISLIQGGGQLALAGFNPELAAFLPSAFSLLFLVLASRTKWYKEDWLMEDSPMMKREEKKEIIEKDNMSVIESLIPYFLMTIVTLSALLIPSINEFLSRVTISPGFRETVTGFGVVNPQVTEYSPVSPFTHASLFLFLAGLISYIYYKKKRYIYSPHSFLNVIKRTLLKSYIPSVAVVSLLGISRIMTGTGQTFVLANGIAGFLGEYYVIVSPFIGLLGSFITGSNMSSNILFGDFQYLTAELIDLNAAAVIGSQTAGGAIGMSIAPGNIVLGTSSVGILGMEGKLILKIIPFTLIVASIVGGMLYIIHLI